MSLRIVDVRASLPASRRRKYATRALATIARLVVHHSGTDGGTPESFAAYHTYALGWPGIGYHYVIAKDGTVYKTNALSTVSYHARGANLNGVGACLVGDFNRKHPTLEQLESLRGLLRVLKLHLPRAEVVFHREVPGAQTTCPGRNFTRDLLQN
jgi:N-acetylmuramoyl-L-alanine amidase